MGSMCMLEHVIEYVVSEGHNFSTRADRKLTKNMLMRFDLVEDVGSLEDAAAESSLKW